MIDSGRSDCDGNVRRVHLYDGRPQQAPARLRTQLHHCPAAMEAWPALPRFVVYTHTHPFNGPFPGLPR